MNPLQLIMRMVAQNPQMLAQLGPMVQQIQPGLLTQLAQPLTKFDPAPQSPNIEDRRNDPPVVPTRQDIARMQGGAPRDDTPEPWEGIQTPSQRDLAFVNDNMDDETLMDFFTRFPKYTRELMIHEGRNPGVTPDDRALTQGEWEHTQQFRSTQIDPQSYPDEEPEEDPNARLEREY
jgi:hypothetical protein